MNKTIFTVSEDKRTLIIERDFNAPQKKLWRAFSEKEMFQKWFAPEGWKAESKKFDFEDGGENHYIMTCVDKDQGEWYGKTSSGKQVYSNIKPEASLSYKDYFTDEEGIVNPEMPVSSSDVTLVSTDDTATKLRIESTYESEEDLEQVLAMGMKEGLTLSLDKLENLVNELAS